MHSELYPRESSCFWCDWTTAKTSHKSHWSVFSLQTSSIATSLAFYSTQTRYRYRYRPGTGHWRGDQARSRTVSVLAIKTDTVQVLVRTLIWASRSLGPGLGLKILGIGHICPTVRQDDIPHVIAKLHLLYVLRMRGLMFNHWHLLSLTSTNIAVFIPGCGHGQWQDSTDKFYAEMYVNVSRCMADSQLLSLSILAVHPTQSSVTPSLVQGCLQLNDLTFNICHQYFFV